MAQFQYELTQRVACEQSPLYFLGKYGYIQNKNEARVRRWETWPYLNDILDILATEHEVIICKARQLGISWLLAGYGLHTVITRPSAKSLYLSQGEEEAWEQLDKSRFIWNALPDYLKLSVTHDSRTWVRYSNESDIKTLPSTEKAGRGTDATLVIRDELAQHPYGEQNYVAIKPAVDGGGQLVDISTVDKKNPDNHFTERVIKARNGALRRDLPSGLTVFTGGESGATLIFAGWKLRPVRQEGMTLEEWFESRIRSKYTPSQVEQEYPSTIEDALKPTTVLAFFDVTSLEEMSLQIQQPRKDFKDFDTYNGMVRVYKPPVVGRSYIIFTDPSAGIADPFVIIVMDAVTGEGVCTATGWIPAKQVGKIHDMLVRAYNNAFNTGEINAQAGGSFIDTLLELETPNRAPRRSAEGKIIEGKIGWQTNHPLRDKALTDLKEAVRTQQITIHDKEAIDEMRSFIRDETGKYLAAGKGHDDWVMAWAGAWQIRKYRPITPFSITSTKYRD